MEMPEIRENLELLPDKIQEVEKQYLSKKYTYDTMGKQEKHLTAKLMCQFSGSNPERERQALASEEYRIHIEGLRVLGQEVARYGAEFHALQNKFEAMRSLNKNV